MTAVPCEGYQFENWAGDVSGTEATVTFTMDRSRTITANFAVSSVRYVITVASIPSSGGSVILDPNQSDYLVNQTVSAAACPSEGYVFSHWSGDLTGSSSPASLLVNDNKSIMAVFNPLLEVREAPADGGRVEASPSTTGGYALGTVVSLNARPALGYLFKEWTGEVAGIPDVSKSAVIVTMDTPRTLTANFVASPPFKVTTGGQYEGGSVTLQPAQPSEGYLAGKEITAYALASEGYVFSYWSGDASGSNPILKLTVDGEKSITAVFDLKVVIECDPAEGGTVEVTSPQASTGYPLGTEITVEAIAGKGYRFKSWDGDISGSENPASVVMDSPKTLTAHFVKETQIPWLWVVLGIAGLLLLLLLVALKLFRVLVIKR